MTENVPEIVVCPPSDEHWALFSLLTPSHPKAIICPLSGGSDVSPGVAPPKCQHKQVASPGNPTSPCPPNTSGFSMLIPSHQNLTPVVDHIADAVSPTGPIYDEELVCQLIAGTVNQSDPTNPKTQSTLKMVLSCISPDLDVDTLIAQHAQGLPLSSCLILPCLALHCLTSPYLTLPHLTPPLSYLTLPLCCFPISQSTCHCSCPLAPCLYALSSHCIYLPNLPDPSVRTLLPSFQLVSSASTSIHSIPTNLVLLNSHNLGLPSKVITIMKGNWATYILLNALSTTSLLSIASSSKDKTFQNLSVSDSRSLKLSAPKLNKRDEPLMSAHDWLHTHSCLILCICKFLPGPADQIVDMWAAHFDLVYNRVDFFLKFPLYLTYDIHLHKHYIYDTSFDPSTWQSGVWDQIVEDMRTKGFSAVFYPSATFIPASSHPASFNRPDQPFWTSCPPIAPSTSGSHSITPSHFCCIFGGDPFCINCAI